MLTVTSLPGILLKEKQRHTSDGLPTLVTDGLSQGAARDPPTGVSDIPAFFVSRSNS